VLVELTQLAALAPDDEAEYLAEELATTRAELDQLRADQGGPGLGEGSEAHHVRVGGQ
jgi:hypothetical protein